MSVAFVSSLGVVIGSTVSPSLNARPDFASSLLNTARFANARRSQAKVGAVYLGGRCVGRPFVVGYACISYSAWKPESKWKIQTMMISIDLDAMVMREHEKFCGLGEQDRRKFKEVVARAAGFY